MVDMKELTQLSEQDLTKSLTEVQHELLAWQEKVMAGKETNHAKLRWLRRDVARIKTALQHVSKS